MIKVLLAKYSLIAFVVLLIMSCQEEKIELIDPDDDTTIPISSLLSQLMKNIVTHDGSFDDVIDGGNCYSILLPYTIFLNGEETVIDGIQDYDLIHATDIIQIEFPVVVTMHNYTQQIITNQEALENLSVNCNSIDDDIECIDFGYPIEFSVFNTNNNTFNIHEVLHDEEAYNFMEELGEFTVLSIEYPIDLLLNTGQIIIATHNDELQSGILYYVDSCDEND